MLETLFSFSGRMQRLRYFGYGLLSSIIGLIAIFAAAFMGGIVSAAGGTAAVVAGSSFAAILAVIPMLWSSFALQAKRLRDAGFPPAIVIPAFIAFALFDSFVLSRHLGAATHQGLLQGSLAGAFVNIAYAAVLLFWPSADGVSETSTPSSTSLSRLDDPAALAAAARASFRPEPVSIAPAAMPALAMPGGPRPSFGQRRRV